MAEITRTEFILALAGLPSPDTLEDTTIVGRFAGVDLSDLDLAGMDLRNLNLNGANLRHTVLRDCILTNSFIGHADLREANLQGAEAYETHFNGSDATGAMFNGIYADAANLEGVNFTHADLTGAHLWECSCFCADFTGARLVDVDMTGAKFANNVWTKTTITGGQWSNLNPNQSRRCIPFTAEQIHTTDLANVIVRYAQRGDDRKLRPLPPARSEDATPADGVAVLSLEEAVARTKGGRARLIERWIREYAWLIPPSDDGAGFAAVAARQKPAEQQARPARRQGKGARRGSH